MYRVHMGKEELFKQSKKTTKIGVRKKKFCQETLNIYRLFNTYKNMKCKK